MKLACLQLFVQSSKDLNLQKAAQLVQKASKQGAQVVLLPECFNSPYGTNYFKEYAEPIVLFVADSRMVKQLKN